MTEVNGRRFVCEQRDCTACGACLIACPQKCIDFEKDDYDRRVAVINSSKCNACTICERICPQNDFSESLFNSPLNCFVGWSNDFNIRKKSASGGVATELYRFFAMKNNAFCGVSINEKIFAKYKLYEGIENFTRFQNSKYVESFTNDVFKEIAYNLNSRNVLFIGLPCQVDGLIRYLKLNNSNVSNLFTVDIVCHGVSPTDYLKQHITYCEQKYKFDCTDLSFRDPEFGTETFTLTLKNNGIIKYYKKVNRNDLYQVGYHKGIIYRDNCYRCRYARNERISDLTISDFTGLGKLASCNFTNASTSCVLANTEKGLHLLGTVCENGLITIYERPLGEALEYEKQLIHPTTVPPERSRFLERYKVSHDFEKSIRLATRRIVFLNEIRFYLCVDKIRSFIRKILPSAFKKKVKTILGIE